MMECPACMMWDEFLIDGLCTECDLVRARFLARRPVKAAAKPQKCKTGSQDGLCAHVPCTNVLVPSGKAGRPSAYCSPGCRETARAEYDAERMRMKREADRKMLIELKSTYGQSFIVIDPHEKEPRDGWDVGQTSHDSVLTVIGSDRPWNEVA